MTAGEKIKKAVEILKAAGAKGKFRFHAGTGNNVEVFSEAGLDSYVNIISGMIREV